MILPPMLAHFLTPNRRTLLFALKALISMSLALFIAMALELERPFWAVVASMLLQARPEGGLVVEKALYLVTASLVGAAAALMIINYFSQSPFIAIAILAGWSGLTSWAGARTLHVNHNYLYAVISVTTVLITLLLMSDASTATSSGAFNIARSRISEAMVGAFCAAIVSVLFFPFRLRDLLNAHGETVIVTLLSGLNADLKAPQDTPGRAARMGRLLAAISQLNHDARAAFCDGPLGRPRAQAAWRIVNAAIKAAAGADALVSLPEDASPAARALLDQVTECISTMQRQRMQRIGQLNLLDSALASARVNSQVDTATLDILAQIVLALQHAVHAAQGLHSPLPDADAIKTRPVSPWQDPLLSLLAALRTVVVFTLLCCLWIATGSPSTVVMMMVLPLLLSIAFSQAPAPEVAVKKCALGATLAILATVGLALPLLSGGSGHFAVLIMVMSGPLFIALMALSWGPTAPYGMGFCLTFAILTQPSNQMVFAADATLTTGLALLCGLGLLWSVFILTRLPATSASWLQRRRIDYFYQGLDRASASRMDEDSLISRQVGMILRIYHSPTPDAHLAGLNAIKALWSACQQCPTATDAATGK